MRLLVAVLASTFVVIPLTLLQAALVGDLDSPLLVPFLLGALWIAAILIVAAGLPLHFTLKHFDLQRGLYYGAAGFSLAALFVVIGQPFGNDGYPLIAFQALQLGIFGTVAALVFWRIAVPNSTRNK